MTILFNISQALGVIFALLALFVTGCGDGEKRTKRDTNVPIELPAQCLERAKWSTLLVDEAFGDNRLLIYSNNMPQTILSLRKIEGHLCVFVVHGTSKSSIIQLDMDELSLVQVDYSDFSEGTLSITELTDDIRTCEPDRDDEYVLFVRTTYTIHSDGAVNSTDTLLLQPEPSDPQRIQKLVQDAIHHGKITMDPSIENAPVAEAEKSAADFFDPVIHLRNIGMGDPKAALDAFGEIAKAVPLDGWVGWAFGQYEGEVYRAQEIVRKQLHNPPCMKD